MQRRRLRPCGSGANCTALLAATTSSSAVCLSALKRWGQRPPANHVVCCPVTFVQWILQHAEVVQEDAGEEGELPPGEAPVEAETGCNKTMFFVTSGLGQPCTLLEDVTPAQVRAARGADKLLTGQLDAPVHGYPPFPGKERHFLRAQIARISHATTLCPKGLYNAPEEGEGEPETNEEYQALPLPAMQDPSNWCHWCDPNALSLCARVIVVRRSQDRSMCRAPHIKAMGVTVLPEVPDAEDEENPPVLLPEQTEKGPAILTPAVDDCAVRGMHAWLPFASSISRTVKSQVVGVKSVAWPGAIALTDGKVWCNAYAGWGLKRGAPARPPPPPVLQSEHALPQECNDLPPPPPPPDAEEEDE